ncbi:TetR/AcrR family transcriptional regulator C-terminal domain-containing protein [Spiractinospora alimapuensis]|nr:TetR/AcrR family transcriptional regulator C-terminal domain-containing protein [Spiractinospora alimapuensis]
MNHWAGELWTVFQRRPWLLRIPFDRPPLGPNQLTWLDRLLQCLQTAGLRGEESMASGLFLISAIRGLALVDTDLGRSSQHTEAPTDTSGILAQLVDHATFPGLAKAIAHTEQATAPLTPDSPIPVQLRFGLDRFCDGVEAWVKNARS